MHFVGFGFEPAEEAADSVPVARIPKFGQGAGAASLALDDKGLLLGSEFVERNFERDFASAAGFFEGLLALFVGVGLPRFNHASCDGELAVGESEGLIDFDNTTEAAAGGAGAEGMVEGEEGGDGSMEIALIAWAEVAVGVEMGVGWGAGEGDGEDSFAVAKAGGNGLGESRFGGGGEGETILNDEDEEVLVGGGRGESLGEGFETGGLIEAVGLALKENATETLARKKRGGFVGGSFLRKRNAKEKPGLLIGVLGKKVMENGLGGPGTDGFGAVGTGEFSEAGKEEFEVVGNLGNRADGATGGANGVALAEGDGGGNPLDAVDAGAVHAFEKLASVGAEGFGVAALAFGVESVEGKGGFA